MKQLTGEEVQHALAPLSDMLASDGYAVRLTPADGSLTVHIDATSDACAECLAPADTIEMIVIDRLRSAGVNTDDLRVDIVLPAKT